MRTVHSHLFPCEHKALLLWWDALNFFNFALNVQDLRFQHEKHTRLNHFRNRNLLRTTVGFIHYFKRPRVDNFETCSEEDQTGVRARFKVIIERWK